MVSSDCDRISSYSLANIFTHLVIYNKSLTPAQIIFYSYHPSSAKGIISYMIIFLARDLKSRFPTQREYNQRSLGKVILFFLPEMDKMQTNALLF